MLPDTGARGNTPRGEFAPAPGPGRPDFWTHARDAAAESVAAVEDGTRAEWSLPFDLARLVRAHPHAARHKPLTVARRVYAAADLTGLFPDEEDFAVQFSRAWNKVRLLPGENPLATAARFAADAPLGLRAEHADEVTDGYRRFVSLAGWLCVVVGKGSIKLPCRQVAEALGVRAMTVSCYRQQAIEHGYLTLRKEHRYGGAGKGEATEFDFPWRWWKCLVEKMPKGES